MLRRLYSPRHQTKRQKTQANTDQLITHIIVAPNLNPLNNSTRLAQYRRKKAIFNLNDKASFPLEIYHQEQRP